VANGKEEKQMTILAAAGSSMVVLYLLWLFHRCAVRSGQRRVREMQEYLRSLTSQGEGENHSAFVRPSTDKTGHVEYRAVLFGDGSVWMKPKTVPSCASMAGGENLSSQTEDSGHPWPTEQRKNEAVSCPFPSSLVIAGVDNTSVYESAKSSKSWNSGARTGG
jgi:hypothetical protein